MVGNNFLESDGGLATEPWLFAFMTTDGYAESGFPLEPTNSCFANIDDTCCSGSACWVSAMSPPYAPGITTLGQYVKALGTAPDEMSVQIWNANSLGYDNWYVYIDGTAIGYYPGSAFHGSMQTTASYMQVGGEILIRGNIQITMVAGRVTSQLHTDG